jgi:3-oxoacyl-[acyl-carrier protein] reductase
MAEGKKVALVTGASRGIGEAIARSLAADGFTVVGTATSDRGAEAISSYLAEENNLGCGIKLNVADQDSVTMSVKAIAEQFEPPLVLVNNAGITRDNILMRMKEAEWQDVMDTNLSGLYRVSKACLRGMTKARWGRIVNITSVVGSMGNIGQSNYAATKAQRDLLLQQIPLGRLGSTAEIAALVSFLCSDMASYITGETVHINGGMHMG